MLHETVRSGRRALGARDRRNRKLGAKTIACAAIMVGALVLGAIPATGQDAAQLLDRGKRAFEDGDFEAARTDLWAYLEATAGLTGPSRLPQADALYTIALMEADAGIAAQHYRTIVEEYAASSVADEALFRLAQLDLVEGRTEEAREKLQRLSVDYPFSRYQAEIPLWAGKAWLADRQYRQATDAFIEGFTRVKRMDLPQELSAGQREALGAEYVYQLARAFGEEGDSRTATQYYAMLALDYPDSPQAAEARLAMGAEGEPVQVAVADEAEGGQAPTGEPVAPAEEPVTPADEPVEEAPEIVIEDAGPREDAPSGAAEGGAPVYVPNAGAGQAPTEQAPDVIIEDARPREDPPRYEPAAEEPVREEPPPVIIEDARPREEPSGEPDTVWIQVGAFTSAANAAALSSRLKADGFFPEVAIGVVDGQGYYRVRLGPFALPSAAERLEETRRRLEAGGYPARQVDD
ncbi:MAG TPA: SPOR domain-containing protein [Gemmatimonadota bacterium]|nr:SPOR domain-containing protein [Gemmatimonadota bacterium]